MIARPWPIPIGALIQRIGVTGVTCVVAAVALCLAQLLVIGLDLIVKSAVLVEDVVIASIIALIVAPLTTARIISLIDELDHAKQDLIRDIAARRRAEDALNEQRAFLRTVIDTSPNLIFAKDRAGRFTLVNRAVAEALGTSVEDLIGKTVMDFNPKEAASSRQGDLEVMASLQDRLLPEAPLTDSRGRQRWFQTVKRPIVDESGMASQVLGVSTEITERKLLEDQLRQAQKMEAIGRLAGGVAHDFNNLLTVVIGYTQLALKWAEAPQLAAPRRYLAEIEQAAGRATSLTHQLLAFSSRQVLQPQVLQLNAVVAETVSVLRRLIGEDILLESSLAADSGKVCADPAQLTQVLINLALNARDAMPGGGTLSISTARTDQPGGEDRDQIVGPPLGYAIISVVDTGIGMDEETLAHVFEPFFTTKEQRSGFGLAVAYGIVQQSGGHITVESQPDSGTRFTIYLPRVTSPVATVETVASAARGRGEETVLLVEDEAPLRDLVQHVLEDRGFRVLAAADGAQALAAAAQDGEPIQLLLSDVVMPGMSGVEVAKRLRERYPEISVLFMSGYSHGAAFGVLGHNWSLIQKPFTPEELERKMHELLSGAR